MAPGCKIADKPGVPLVVKLMRSFSGLRHSPKNYLARWTPKSGFALLNLTHAFAYSKMTLALSFLRCTLIMFLYRVQTSSC